MLSYLGILYDGSTWAGIETLMQAMDSSAGEVSYILGGWVLDLYPRGVGIEFRADLLGALIVLVVLGVGLIVTIYSKLPVQEETPKKEAIFYPLFLCKLRDWLESPSLGMPLIYMY